MAQQFREDPNQVGRLFKNTSSKGTEYFTFVADQDIKKGTKFVAFANTKKKSEKSPDFYVYKQRDRAATPAPADTATEVPAAETAKDETSPY